MKTKEVALMWIGNRKKYFTADTYFSLILFNPVFFFCIPRSSGFLMISKGVKTKNWLDMS